MPGDNKHLNVGAASPALTIQEIAAAIIKDRTKVLEAADRAANLASVRPQLDSLKKNGRLRGAATGAKNVGVANLDPSVRRQSMPEKPPEVAAPVPTFPDGTLMPANLTKISLRALQPKLSAGYRQAVMSMQWAHAAVTAKTTPPAERAKATSEYILARAAVAAGDAAHDSDGVASSVDGIATGNTPALRAFLAARTVDHRGKNKAVDVTNDEVKWHSEAIHDGGLSAAAVQAHVQLAKNTGPPNSGDAGNYDLEGRFGYNCKDGPSGHTFKSGDVRHRMFCTVPACGFQVVVLCHTHQNTSTVKSRRHSHDDSISTVQQSGRGKVFYRDTMEKFIGDGNPTSIAMMEHARETFFRVCNVNTGQLVHGPHLGVVEWENTAEADTKRTKSLNELKKNVKKKRRLDGAGGGPKYTPSTKHITPAESVAMERECKEVVANYSKQRTDGFVADGKWRPDQQAHYVEHPDDVFSQDPKNPSRKIMQLHLINPSLLRRIAMAEFEWPGGMKFLRFDTDHKFGMNDALISDYTNGVLFPGGQLHQTGFRSTGTKQTTLAAHKSLAVMEKYLEEHMGGLSLRARIGATNHDAAGALSKAMKMFFEGSPAKFIEARHMLHVRTNKLVKWEFASDGSSNFDPEIHIWGVPGYLDHPGTVAVTDGQCQHHFLDRCDTHKMAFFAKAPAEASVSSLSVDDGYNGEGEEPPALTRKQKIPVADQKIMTGVLKKLVHLTFDRTSLAWLLPAAVAELCRAGLSFNAAKFLLSQYRGFEYHRDRLHVSPTTNGLERSHKDVHDKAVAMALVNDHPVDKNRGVAIAASLDTMAKVMSKSAPAVWGHANPRHTYDYNRLNPKKQTLATDTAGRADKYIALIKYEDKPASKPTTGDVEHLKILEINPLPEIVGVADDAMLEAEQDLLAAKDLAALAALRKETVGTAAKLVDAVDAFTDTGGVDQDDPEQTIERLTELGTMGYTGQLLNDHEAAKNRTAAERAEIAEKKRLNDRAKSDGTTVRPRRRFMAPTFAEVNRYRFSSSCEMTAQQHEDKMIWLAKAFMGESTISAPFRPFQREGEPYECTFQGKIDRLSGVCILVEDPSATPENGKLPVICNCQEYASTGGFCPESFAVAVLIFGFKVHPNLTFLHRPAERDQKVGSEHRTKPTPAGHGKGLPTSRVVKKVDITFPPRADWAGVPFDPKKLVEPPSPAVEVDDVVSVCFTDANDEKYWRSGKVVKPTIKSKAAELVRIRFADEDKPLQFPAEFFYEMNAEHNYRVKERA